MTHRRTFGRPRLANCWLFIAALLLTGRLRGVAIAWRGWYPPHPIGITWGGRMIHFKSTKTCERFAPLCFHGRVEAFSRTGLFGELCIIEMRPTSQEKNFHG